MLRRFTPGFTLVLVAAAGLLAACSSTGATSSVNVGPNFPAESLYATNTTQNAVSIYPPGTASGSGPQYQIGGSNTGISGPQYIAFDSYKNLYISNYSQSQGTASLIVIHALATGNVVPLGEVADGLTHPRGITVFNISSTKDPQVAITNEEPSAGANLTSQVLVYDGSVLGAPLVVLAGAATGLNVPTGLAFYSGTLYVANQQGATVEGFVVPSPMPTTSTTPSPTPSPTPTASPSVSPSATPSSTPVPTPSPENVAPNFTISGSATGLVSPTGLAVDGTGNIYVCDQGNPGAPTPVLPSILVFAPVTTGSLSPVPIRKISGAATLLVAPTDVKVDTSGRVYVADSTKTGAAVIYVYAAGANGDIAPTTTYTSPGSVIGIALTP